MRSPCARLASPRLGFFLGLSLCALVRLAAQVDKQPGPLSFIHEDPKAAQLAQLRRDYDFDEYLASAKDEFEAMNMLKRWCFDKVRYGGAPQYTQLRNSLTILQKAKRGEVFWCNNIGTVYMQCALAMGWTSRYVFVRNTKGESHILNDIWSNQYRKWVMMDATWNIYLEKDGLPLSLPEMRAEWRKDNGESLVYVYGAGDNLRRFTKKELPIERSDNFLYKRWPVTEEWISFGYLIAIVGRNNFFTSGDGSGEAIWDKIYTFKDKFNSGDKVWEFNHYPSPGEDKLFHPLNLVSLSCQEPEKGEKDYTVRISRSRPDSYTPYFQAYELRLDGGAWADSPAETRLRLGPGSHVLEARARNSLGVRGPIESLEVAVAAGPLAFFQRLFQRRQLD